jgi:hypothetical protein
LDSGRHKRSWYGSKQINGYRTCVCGPGAESPVSSLWWAGHRSISGRPASGAPTFLFAGESVPLKCSASSNPSFTRGAPTFLFAGDLEVTSIQCRILSSTGDCCVLHKYYFLDVFGVYE